MVGIIDAGRELEISPARFCLVGHAFVIVDAGVFDVIFQAITGTLKGVSECARRKPGDGNKDDDERSYVQGVLQERTWPTFGRKRVFLHRR